MMNRLDFWLAVMVAASMASLRTGAARGPRDLTAASVKLTPALSMSGLSAPMASLVLIGARTSAT